MFQRRLSEDLIRKAADQNIIFACLLSQLLSLPYILHLKAIIFQKTIVKVYLSIMSFPAMDRLKQMTDRYSLDKSHLGKSCVKVRFINNCDEKIRIFWRDYDGKEVLYFDNVLPGDM